MESVGILDDVMWIGGRCDQSDGISRDWNRLVYPHVVENMVIHPDFTGEMMVSNAQPKQTYVFPKRIWSVVVAEEDHPNRQGCKKAGGATERRSAGTLGDRYE